MFKLEACSFYLGVLFGHLSAQIIFHKTTKPSILSQLKTMEERLERLMTEVESGIYSSPHEVHKLAEAFHDDVKKLAASCKDCEWPFYFLFFHFERINEWSVLFTSFLFPLISHYVMIIYFKSIVDNMSTWKGSLSL